MFIIKNYYYLYIENTKDIEINSIKKSKKIFIIYRNQGAPENKVNLIAFRKQCKQKRFGLYIANNYKLAKYCKADGLYISSYNKKKYLKKGLNIIGSAHNFKEIYQELKQGCSTIILSRLFKTSYKNKKNNLGIIKFNLIRNNYLVNIIPLGGINNLNLLKLNLVMTKGVALFSEVKKKPVITNRLF